MGEAMRSARDARIVAVTLGALMLANTVTPAAAEQPANGQDINGKTVYLAPGAALRSGPNLTDAVVFRAPGWTRLRGDDPPCTSWNCKVIHEKQSLFARRSRLDLADRSAEADKPPGGPAASIPAAPSSGPREKLVRGDEGDDVRVIQEALAKRGFDVQVDGKYGSGTEAAVRRFQRDNGLNPDGRVGPLTRQKLL